MTLDSNDCPLADSDCMFGCAHPDACAMITEAKFKEATGHTPQDDALERCNCALEGRPGHWHCGWNVTYGKPNFYLSMTEVEEDRRKRGIPSALTPTQ